MNVRWWWELIIKSWPLLVVLTVGVLMFRAHSLSNALELSRKANSDLVGQLSTKDKAILALQDNATAERALTDAQLAKERQLKGKLDAENKALREILDASDCSHQPLPGAALDILRGQAGTTGHANDLRPTASSAAAAVR